MVPVLINTPVPVRTFNKLTYFVCTKQSVNPSVVARVTRSVSVCTTRIETVVSTVSKGQSSSVRMT